MNSGIREWKEAEVEIAGLLEEDLAESLEVGAEVEDLAFNILKSAAERGTEPVLFEVHANLLARALQDLRVCVWAATRGYTMQSWTLASSCMEAAYAIGFIGKDVSRAKQWLEHSDPMQLKWNMFDCILHSQKYLGIESDPTRLKDRTQEEYRLYRLLCMAKHTNPVAERNRHLDRTTGRFYLTPIYTSNTAQEAQLGLALATRSVVVGLWVFRNTHLGAKSELDEKIIETARRGLGLLKSWQKRVDKEVV